MKWLARRSPKAILILWLVGLGLQAGLLGFATSRQESLPSRLLDADWFTDLADSAPTGRLSPEAWDSLKALAFVLLRDAGAEDTACLDSVARDFQLLDQSVRDGLWQALEIPERLTLAQEDSLRRLIGDTAAPILDALAVTLTFTWWGLAGVLALLLAVPLILMFVTVLWFLARRRYAARPSLGAA